MKDVAGVIQPDKNTMENLRHVYSRSTYSPSETQELLEANRAKDNNRDMLTRMIGQEIINAQADYAVHPAPDGMKNQRGDYFDENGKRKKRTKDIINAFVAAKGDELKADLEQQIDHVERKILAAKMERTALEVTGDDLTDFVARVNGVMEHPARLLLKPGNQMQRREYFSLMFEKLPYDQSAE